MNTELTPLHGTIMEVNDIPLPEIVDRLRVLLAATLNNIWEIVYLVHLVRIDIPSKELYGNWVSANFADTSQRTLYNYSQLAEHFYKRQEVAEIIPISGLYLLAQPNCDDFREDIIEEFQGEDKVSYKQVQDAIKSHKPEREETIKSYKLTQDHISAIWGSMNITIHGATDRTKVLFEEIKVILGEPQ